MNLIVAWDLIQPGQRYKRAEQTLVANCVEVFKPLNTTYFVTTNLTAPQLRDRLKLAGVDSNDKLIVVEAVASGDWATFRIDPNSTGWLKRRMAA